MTEEVKEQLRARLKQLAIEEEQFQILWSDALIELPESAARLNQQYDRMAAQSLTWKVFLKLKRAEK